MSKGLVRTMKGEVIDMAALASRNGHVVALGNASMNARGDLVDRQGNVLKAREVIVQDYYKNNPKAVTQSVSLKDLGDEVLTPRQMAEQAEEAGLLPKRETKKRKIVDDESED